MLQVASGEKQADNQRNGQETSVRQDREPLAEPKRSAYGNQALLRMGRAGAMPPQPPLRPSQTFVLQRKCACGNPSVAGGECEECKAKMGLPLQTKLTIGEPGDSFEQEADRVAEQVMAAPAHSTVSAAPLRIQRFVGQANSQTESVPASVEQTLASPGSPLEPALREDMEQRFGHDFSGVRVHLGADAGQSARDVSAKAYTVGQNIVFGAGRFAPGTHEGRRLLAHELTHVVQQSGSEGIRVGQGNENRGLSPICSQIIQPAPETEVESGAPATADKDKSDKAEGTLTAGGRVVRLVLATVDGVLTVETLSTDYLYELDRWNIPEGSYTASVTIDGNKVKFDFGENFANFHFSYNINKGQDNPTTLLKGQKSVTVDVVASHSIDPKAKPIQCLLPMGDQILIKKFASSTPLFKPIKKQSEWFIGKVPLGFLGWIDVNAQAGISLAGLLSYGYGPGVLSDICLYRSIDNNHLGGSARFKFGAAMSPSVNAKGSLKAVASYVGVVDLVSALGNLDASAIGHLSGKLDGRVDLSYDRSKENWNFDAEALVTGVAGLKLKATAAAAIEVLYKEVWSKQWKLLDEDFHIGWKGGLRIGTDTHPYFDFGSVGILSDDDKSAQPGGPVLATATAPDPLAPEAKVDDQKMLEASINKDTGPPAKVPEGLTPDDALPIIWYKPLNIYPKEIAIPRAIRPEMLDRDDGPTEVEYGASRRRTGREFIGVGDDDKTNQTNWPLPVRKGNSPGKRFQYVEKTAGDTVKDRLRNTFNDELLPAGQTLAGNGFDMDHVHEKQFGGQDAAPNLWPAESSANRQAGELHNQQLYEYRTTIGNIAGRWFEIILVLRP